MRRNAIVLIKDNVKSAYECLLHHMEDGSIKNTSNASHHRQNLKVNI